MIYRATTVTKKGCNLSRQVRGLRYPRVHHRELVDDGCSEENRALWSFRTSSGHPATKGWSRSS